MHFRVEPVADMDRLTRSVKPCHEPIVDAFLDVETGRRDADLAGVADLGGASSSTAFEVDVVEDEHRAWPPSSIVVRFIRRRRVARCCRPRSSR